ncbi:hypothetical protein Ancab_011620 [Ancistrocladus abbreviatus]
MLLDLIKWLKTKPEWNYMGGRDHLLVAGRVTWDFRRGSEDISGWGNQLLNLPETRNMTTLVLESCPCNNNDFAIPYPTYFHPLSRDQALEWQERLRRQERHHLFCFVGAPRRELHSIRNDITSQCQAVGKRCRFHECNPSSGNCDQPDEVIKSFQESVFCLQPPGDSPTRRSVFDSILVGCIPVFFPSRCCLCSISMAFAKESYQVLGVYINV